MATPPRTKQLTVEVPEDADAWFSPFLGQLNDFVLSVTAALQTSLTRSQNFMSQRYTLELTTGAVVANSFPITFNCTLPQAPEEVRVTQVRGGATSGAVTCATWTLAEGNRISLPEITGLAANTSYTIYFTIT